MWVCEFVGMWGEKSSSSSSSIFFLGPLRACPAGAEVRWLQAGHTRKRLRLGSAKEPLRALPAPPSRNVCRCFSGQRTLSPAARGGRGRPSVILADELIHLPHKCHHPDAYRGWQGSFSAHILVFTIIFTFVSSREDEGKDYGKDKGRESRIFPYSCPLPLRPPRLRERSPPYLTMIINPGSAPCHTIWS